MIYLLYFFVICIVISLCVYLVSLDRNEQPLRKALMTFAQLVGGMIVLALVVYILTNV